METEKTMCLLAYLGFYNLRRKDGQLSIDGIPGPAFKEAVKTFQERYTLPATGEPDRNTEKALRDAVAYGMPVIDSDDLEIETGSVWEDPQVKPYFKRSEFACPCPRCGGFPTEPHPDLVRACAWIRHQTERPFVISSGVRCQAHNDELPGSVPDSRHIRGRAVDFTVPGMSPEEIKAMALMAPGIVYAYIMPSGWVHMDIGN